jgi:selenium-binding protein 1
MSQAQIGFASPDEAMRAPREEIVYVAGLYAGTGEDRPDFLAVVDVDPSSSTYSQIIHRTEMPNVGDELHHYGWQICSSACHTDNRERKHIVVPGMRSSRIHIVDVGTNPRSPELVKVIEPDEVKSKTGLSAPHTVHCMPGDNVVLSMLGNADGGLGAGFMVLDAQTFDIKGRWESNGAPEWNYDFWYQPRKNTLISSEWAAPEVFLPGFALEDVAAGRYGHSIHFWDLDRRVVTQSIDLGDTGMIPLEIRWLHNPDSESGYVGAALSSTMWRFHQRNGKWTADKVIETETRDLEGFPVPVPSLITDLVVSMDDRYLYFSGWLHGDLRQYDISDPANPRQTGSVLLGGLFEEAHHPNGTRLDGGPQMLQLSMDGRRLYVTNSLFSTWDNQFYPDLNSWMVQVDIDEDGSMSVNPDFFVEFSKLPGKPRAHEMHLPGGDVTTEIFQ